MDVYIKDLDGPLFFGFTASFQDRISAVAPEAKVLIIRMDKVPYIDQSGLYALETAILDLRRAGVEVFLTGLRQQPYDMLRRINIIPDLIGKEHAFDDVDQCLAWLESKTAQEQGEASHGATPTSRNAQPSISEGRETP